MSGRRLLASLAAAGLILSAVTAAVAISPAAYASPPGSCSGQGCSIDLSQYIQLSGDVGGGSNYVTTGTPVTIPPPPCWYTPYVNGQDMYNVATKLNIFQQFMPEIKTDRNKPGLWYIRNTYVNCTLTEAIFVPPGTQPPLPPIPPAMVAAYAYNQMTMPVPQLTLSPVHKSWVNLPTYVWASYPGGGTTRTITASLATTAGQETVSVWAQAGNLTVNASSPGTAYSAGCGPTGSRYPASKPPAASSGPGTTPDCGVVYTAPVTGSPLTVSTTWSTSWGNGVLSGPGANALAPITVTGPQPPDVVPVAEIQSLNGG